jgi:hypothetical protein
LCGACLAKVCRFDVCGQGLFGRPALAHSLGGVLFALNESTLEFFQGGPQSGILRRERLHGQRVLGLERAQLALQLPQALSALAPHAALRSRVFCVSVARLLGERWMPHTMWATSDDLIALLIRGCLWWQRQLLLLLLLLLLLVCPNERLTLLLLLLLLLPLLLLLVVGGLWLPSLVARTWCKRVLNGSTGGRARRAQARLG